MAAESGDGVGENPKDRQRKVDSVIGKRMISLASKKISLTVPFVNSKMSLETIAKTLGIG